MDDANSQLPVPDAGSTSGHAVSAQRWATHTCGDGRSIGGSPNGSYSRATQVQLPEEGDVDQQLQRSATDDGVGGWSAHPRPSLPDSLKASQSSQHSQGGGRVRIGRTGGVLGSSHHSTRTGVSLNLPNRSVSGSLQDSLKRRTSTTGGSVQQHQLLQMQNTPSNSLSRQPGSLNGAGSVLDGADSEDPATAFTVVGNDIVCFRGFQLRWYNRVCFYVIGVMTLGIAFLILHWWPWLRPYIMCTRKAPLSAASHVLVKHTSGNTAPMYEFARFKHEVLPDGRLVLSAKDLLCQSNERFIFFRGHRYILDPLDELLDMVPDVPSSISSELEIACKSVPMGNYQGKNANHSTRQVLYGPNKLDVPLKHPLALVWKIMWHPYFAFQYFSVIVWCYQDYIIYSVFLMLITWAAIVVMVIQMHGNSKRLSKLAESEGEVEVVSCGESRICSSLHLVPGDVIVVKQGLMHADLVLISGEAMVDEALLTGENFPVRKVELPRSPGKYHQDADAQSTIRAGTIVLRTQSPFADTPALGMVMATGFGTSKGRLLRRIIYPGQLRRIFYSDALYFVLFMGIVALGMFGFSAAVFFKYGASVTDILWKLLDMITIAVPPALPACLTIASSLSILRLQRKKIFTVDAERIGVAGSVNTVCFDKTGTLTDSTLALEALWVVTPESAEDGITSLSVSDLRVGSCSSEGSKSTVQDSADSASSAVGNKAGRGWMAMGGELVEMWTADDGETDVPARLRHSWSDVTSCAKVRFTDRLHLHSGSSSDIPATLESSMYRSHVGPESLQQRCECSEEEPPASPSSHRGAHSQSYLTTIASKSDSGLDEVSDRRGQAQSKLKIASSDEVVPPKLKMDRVSAADVKRCRTPLIQELLACCHGLNCIGDSELVGDPLDLLLFRYTGWQLNDTLGTLRVRPPGFDEAEGDVKGMNSTTWSTEWSVLLRFAFRSDWGRCTVVASGPKNIGMWAFTKGAPEKILGLVDKASVPPSILEAIERETQAGNRVLALAARPVSVRHHLPLLRSLQQGWFERGMQLLGLIVMNSPMQEDAAEVTQELTRANMRCLIMSGDHINTTANVATQIGLMKPDIPLLKVYVDSELPDRKPVHEQHQQPPEAPSRTRAPQWQYKWVMEVATRASILAARRNSMGATTNTSSGSSQGSQRVSRLKLRTVVMAIESVPSCMHDQISEDTSYQEVLGMVVKGDVRCAVSGQALETVTSAAMKGSEPELVFLHVMLEYASVFARMRPRNKQRAVELLGEGDSHIIGDLPSLKGIGLTTMFIGDGANDIGALQAASLGITLCEAEASVAAPLTCKNNSIRSVIDLIAEGRCTLTVHHTIAYYIICYAWIQVLSTNVAYVNSAMLMPNLFYLLQDLFVATVLATCMSCSNPCPKLSTTRPPVRLLRVEVVCVLVVQMAIIAMCQLAALSITRSMRGYTPFDPYGDGNVPLMPQQIPETTTLFIICFSQLLITAVVFNLGSEYRQAMMSNPYLMAAMTILTTIYLLILFLPHDNAFMGGFMQLAYDQVAYRLRFWMLGLNAVNAALSIGCHVAIKAMFRCRGGGSLFPPLPH